jgi:hypothetical protein
MEKPNAYIVYNDIESKHCQEMLFELGYKWHYYVTEYSKIPYDYPCVIYEEYFESLSYSSLNYYLKEEYDNFNEVNYKKILREQKLKRILK